jgi:transposase, IS6 family
MPICRGGNRADSRLLSSGRADVVSGVTVEMALLRWRMAAPGGESDGMMARRSRQVCSVPRSAFAGFRFPPEVIVLAVRRYLRFGLSYRDVEELLVERGIEVDHVTVYRWVHRFMPRLADAARPCRHAVGDRWYVDETYVKVAGRWRYVYRAIDQYGQIIDVYVSLRRDVRAARWFFTIALGAHIEPIEVVTDRAWTLLAVVDELMPGAFHNTKRYANNRIEADHGRLKACGCRKLVGPSRPSVPPDPTGSDLRVPETREGAR